MKWEYIGTTSLLGTLYFQSKELDSISRFDPSIYAAVFLFRYSITLVILKARTSVISLIWIHLKGDGQVFDHIHV